MLGPHNNTCSLPLSSCDNALFMASAVCKTAIYPLSSLPNWSMNADGYMQSQEEQLNLLSFFTLPLLQRLTVCQ